MKKTSNIETGCFWADGAFVETLSHEEAKEREKTLNKKHNEDMRFNCRKCNKKISAHNKDWHNGMCDGCFNKEFFPDEKKN